VHLGRERRKFERRLDFVDGRFARFVAERPTRLTFEEWLILEGIISSAWQYWGHCCRKIILSSALGAITESGAVLPPSAAVLPLQWERASYLAIQASKKRAAQPAMINSTLRLEPTWGDIDKLPNIATALAPQNLGQLISAFGVATKLKDVQTVRNAAAHRNRQTMQEVLGLAPRYVASTIRHPSEASLWEDPATKNFAFLSWTEEMRDAIKIAVA